MNKSAQEMLGPFGSGQGIEVDLERVVACGAGLDLMGLHPLPEILIDDANVWFVADHPFAYPVKPGAACKAVVLVADLHPAMPVEDLATYIKLVV
jgi:hypothetical protein